MSEQITETCSCGASFTVSGNSYGFTATKDWRATHRHTEPAEPLPAPEGAVEQVLFRWFQATDEGTLKVSWEMYESAMRALGIETCPVCKGCGGCGECANCDAREEDWGAEGCTRCHDGRGILNPARYDKLRAALARSTPAPSDGGS